MSVTNDLNSGVNSNVPVPQTAVLNRQQAVEAFEQTIGGLYEKDYGDFMRKASLYMERLRVDVGAGQGSSARLLAKMKQYLVYAPSFDIEATRLQLLRDANELRRETN